MYKNTTTFLKDYFHSDIRINKGVYLSQLDSNLLKLEESQLFENAEIFANKYLIKEPEYITLISFIQSSFIRNKKDALNGIVPYTVSLSGFRYTFKNSGGEIWNPDTYKIWQQFLNEIGDKNINIIEDDYTMAGYPLGFNFKFPGDIFSWEDFYEGNYIIATLLYETYYSYFMLGENNHWLRYIETDGHWEIDLDGNEIFECNDYLALDYITPEIENILVSLGYEPVP